MVDITRNFAMIGRILPRTQVRAIGKLLDAAGVDVANEFASGIAITITVVSFIIAAAFLATIPLNWDLIVRIVAVVLGAITIAAIVVGILYELVMLRIERRKTEMEAGLPDFLTLAAANIRAGMQLDKALWYAAKPEFGSLAIEMEMASKRVFSGETTEEALTKLAGRFQSRYLTRTVELIKEGVISGGEMAGILEKTSIDIRNAQLMHREVSASMLMYSIFIAFAAAVGAPFLYMVSYKLISLFEKLWASRPPVEGEISHLVAISPTAPGITSADFILFSAVLVVMTSVMACIIIAVIQTGKKVNALKYVVPFLLISGGVFLVARFLLDKIFGGASI